MGILSLQTITIYSENKNAKRQNSTLRERVIVTVLMR